MKFNNKENLIFSENLIFIKVNLATHICAMRKWQLLLILTHWSCSKCEDILQTPNVHNVTAKEHQVVDRGDPDEILVS